MAGSPSPRRILIVRPSALGDVCRTVPVLVSLRRAFPDAVIDWVVRDAYTAPLAAHPDLHEAIPFPRTHFARWWRSPRAARDLLRWLGDLRRRRYDLVIDCQGLGRSGLITWATGAPRRVGSRRAREFAWLAYTVRHETNGAVHTVDEMLSLLRAEGIEPVPDLRLYAAEPDRAWWRRQQAACGLAGRPYAVLAPTARWSSKRWPVERWCELATALAERGYRALVVIGAPGEAPQVRALLDLPAPVGATVVDLVGRATLGQTMAVVAEAALVVAHDSAPLHMAVGLERPCVGLYGPTDPAQVGPYGRPDAVAGGASGSVNYRASRLGDALMRRITVDEVLRRVDAVGRPAAPPPAGPALAEDAAARNPAP